MALAEGGGRMSGDALSEAARLARDAGTLGRDLSRLLGNGALPSEGGAAAFNDPYLSM